ncbi:MAG TPA: DUF2304 domain-containing protein [Candidatus Andersenbacteria bacterium]|nr:DUF2304 domain-containing protein [Candidatus Andersenbacteria bacterium]
METLDLRLYQVIIVGIAGLMIYFGLEKFIRRKSNQSVLKLLVRIIVWGGMAAIALFPTVTNYLATFIGIEGNINAVVLVGFLLVFLIIFKILSVVERIEQDITRLIRKDALKNKL